MTKADRGDEATKCPRVQSIRTTQAWLRKACVLGSFFLFIALVTSCGTSSSQIATYPNIISTVSAAEAVTMGDITPKFGEELERASGIYSKASGNQQTIERWYDRQVAEQALQFVAQNRDGTIHHTLYQLNGFQGQMVEIVTFPLNSQITLIATYSSLTQVTTQSDDGLLRRMWGRLLTWVGPVPVEYFFDWVLRTFQPIRSVLDALFILPIFNLLLLFRWIFRWHVALLMVPVSIVLGVYSDILLKPHKWIVNFLGMNKYKDGCVTMIYMTAIGVVFDVVFATAIWEVLNGVYDVSPVGISTLSRYIYDFWPAEVKRLAYTPPAASFWGIRLDLPNIIIVPFVMFLMTFVTSFLQQYHFYTLMGMNPGDDGGDILTNGCSQAIRESAILAFLPLGIALYFVIDKIKSLIESVFSTMDLEAAKDASQRNAPYKPPSVKPQRYLRISMVTVTIVWFVFIDRAASAQRGYNLLVNPTLWAVIVGKSDPQESGSSNIVVATSQATIVPNPTTTPTYVPTQTPFPTNTIVIVVNGDVTADRLNMRSGPSTETAIVTKLLKGARVEVLGRTQGGDWLHVRLDGVEGWVSAEYILLDRAIPDLPVHP